MHSSDALEGLSVVLYGRNDGHGYNLPRRAALSINAFAHVLSDRDEILFADCNTPDALPTFPESIADTLTDKARALLRVVRIRPGQFRRLVPRTRLKVHEPFCRNVLVRRANPENHWILSTNSDIVPVNRNGGGLLAGLGEALVRGHLHIAPRGEVPEQLWEGVDRRDPETVHALFRRWGGTLGFSERVDCGPVVLHDGPGDFQLLPRDELFAIDGFDEGILQGWHVDGNLCARMAIRRGRNISLAGAATAYHCDHNRQATPTHRSGFASESAHDLVWNVRQAELPGQRATWGAPDEIFEEIRLVDDAGARFGDGLLALLGDAVPAVASRLGRDTFNTTLDHPADLAFPHLASHLATRDPAATIAYVGRDPRMVGLLRRFLSDRGGRLLDGPGVAGADEGAFWAGWSRCDAVVVDAWAGDVADGRVEWPRDLRRERSAAGERARTQDAILRRLHREALGSGRSPLFLFVGTQNTWMDIDLNRSFDLVLAPFASHVRPAVARKCEPAWREGVRSWWARRRRARRA